MQMLYRSCMIVVALTAACGDGHKAPPDSGAPGGSDGGGDVCSVALDAASLSGSWDPRFTIAGFTGPDGLAPIVYDFAADIDGSIVAAGKFGYVGSAAVAP